MRQVVVNRAILFAALLSILIVREADGYYENGNKLTEACNANATENAAARSRKDYASATLSVF
jgi:hypothetical protein